MKDKIGIILLAVLLTAFISSCCENNDKEECNVSSCCQAVKGDSLMGLWNDAWNAKNRGALQAMIADCALVIDRDWKVEGKDSIFANWIDKNMPVVSNLKTNSLYNCECCCCLTQTGYYSIDYTENGELKNQKGNYTFLWKQQDDKSWKLELMHMTGF